MADNNITSANSVATLSCSVIPAGLKFEGYAVNAMWTKDNEETIEARMGADGKASFGWIPAIKQITFHFSPDSPTVDRLRFLSMTQEALRNPVPLQLVITLPAIGKTATFTNGRMRTNLTIPTAQSVLEPQDVTFVFESCTVI